MNRLHSTLEVALQCHKCGKWLKETEAYFYKYRCTDCVFNDTQKEVRKIWPA